MRCLVVLVLAGAAAAGPLTESRFGEAKTKLLRKRGGSASTEKAVAAALGWLVAHQTTDGYWDADGFNTECDCKGKGGGWHGGRVPCRFDFEVTGLATLALLGAGHSPEKGEHKEAVARALDWLQARGRGGTLFGTSFATQAFAEAYDMTGSKELRDAAERGVAVLLESQLPDGGWRYFVGMSTSGTPTTTAVVTALEVARDAGIEVDREYGAKVLKLLDKLTKRDNGRVAYTLTGHLQGYTPTTTNAASALVCRTYLGASSRDPRVQESLGALARRRPKWSVKFKTMKVKGVERRVQIGYLQHYYWHHGTEALVRIGGGAWSAWNGKLKKALLSKQQKTGHAKGSWDPAGTYGPVGGRVFSTALCAMMLEAYYRY